MTLLLNTNPNPENYYSKLIRDQKFALLPELQLDSGEILRECPIAYKTWGTLNDERDNVLVICHALTGSSDVSDWWGPLIGVGKALDPKHFFIFCGNVLGSPYGSASPVTINPATGRFYASDFPQTTVRDDVRAHKLVLDALGVRHVASVIGGSMGGMATLEWPLCTSPGYVRNIIPIATAADHSAWGISWAETQRQCIYSDPAFQNGYYEPTPEGQPAAGLAAARMIALLTYRSCTSFDSRFGRRPQKRHAELVEPHLDLPRTDGPNGLVGQSRRSRSATAFKNGTSHFSAQGYLHYQGEKFIQRFDANCYLHITNKMDSHDVTLGRTDTSGDAALERVFANVPPEALVVGVETDALFLPEQQERLAASLPKSTLSVLKSPDGHDGFLLEFGQLGALIQVKLRSRFPHLYNREYMAPTQYPTSVVEESLTGEIEQW